MKISIRAALAGGATLLLAHGASAETGITTAPDYPIYAAPSRDSHHLGRVPDHGRVDVLGCFDHRHWCEVSWHGVRGFMDAHSIMVTRRGRMVRANEIPWNRYGRYRD